MQLPSFLKKYFWDVNFDKLDLRKNQLYIIVRLLEYGDIKEIHWLFKNVPQAKIRGAILKSRELSRKTINFWSLFFNLDKTKIRCLEKSYQKMQKRHWSY